MIAPFPPAGHVSAENASKVKVQRPQIDPTPPREDTLCPKLLPVVKVTTAASARM